MSFRKLLLAGAALAASTAAVATPAHASIIDRPHFKVLGVVIVWAADDSTGGTPIATDFVIDDDNSFSGTGGAADTDLIGGAAVDGRTVVTGSLTPTADSLSTAALGDILTIDDDADPLTGDISIDLDSPAAFSAFDVTNQVLTGEDTTYESSFFVASNTAFNIEAEVTSSTVNGDFDLTDIGYDLDVTTTGTAAADGIDFGSRAQSPGPSITGGATLNDLTAPVDVFVGNQRTAATAGSITQQSVRFDATYTLGAGTAYDLSMGAGEVDADVVYTVYVP